MKKIMVAALAALLAAGMLAGCGKKQQAVEPKKELTPADMHPEYYSSEDEIPTDTYCIAHREKINKKKAEVRYYPLYKAESYGDVEDNATGMRNDRFFWLNYNKDEGLIPTMYPGDKIVYKTNSDIPEGYSIEKFYDEGYTIGVAGLYSNGINKAAYTPENENCIVSKNADTKIIPSLGKQNGNKDDDDTASTVVFNTVNGEDISVDSLDPAGMIMGLDKNKTYAFDLRVGTKSYTEKFKANIHEFLLGETYMYNNVDYITDSMMRINMPDFLTTGYYELNGAGAFRFLKTETSYKDLGPADYNDFVYTYEGNTPTGSKDGLILNDDGYLVTYEEYANQKQQEDTDDDDETPYTPMKNEDDIFNYVDTDDDSENSDNTSETDKDSGTKKSSGDSKVKASDDDEDLDESDSDEDNESGSQKIGETETKHSEATEIVTDDQ